MNHLNNPLWPFAIHNGERTEASKKLLKQDQKESTQGLSDAVYCRDRVSDTNLEEEALV